MVSRCTSADKGILTLESLADCEGLQFGLETAVISLFSSFQRMEPEQKSFSGKQPAQLNSEFYRTGARSAEIAIPNNIKM